MLRSSLSHSQTKGLFPGVSVVSDISQSYHRSMATHPEVLPVKKMQKWKRATHFPLLFHIRPPSLTHDTSARGTHKILTITMPFFLLQDHCNSPKPPKSSPTPITESKPPPPRHSNNSKRPIHFQKQWAHASPRIQRDLQPNHQPNHPPNLQSPTAAKNAESCC